MPEANPAELINTIYKMAMMLGGLLAFGAIVFGAITYSVAGGNTEKQSDARDRIAQALLGLLLLFGAYLIITTVNPTLTLVSLPKLERLQTPAMSTSAASGCYGGVGGACTPLGVACKDGCYAAPAMVRMIQCAKTTPNSHSFLVTEAMPPTVVHESIGHRNGCAVDLTVNGYDGKDCTKVYELRKTLQDCGLAVHNEYLKCGGSESDNRTGDHFHVTAC